MNVDIKAIKERCDRATPGPWNVDQKAQGDCTNLDIDCGKTVCDESCKECEWYEFFTGASIDKILTLRLDEWDGINDADADFIAHAREDIPALIAEIESLQAQLADLQAKYDKLAGDFMRVILNRLP
jgi:hypothetical protein